MDYLCAKFGDFSFSRFGFIVRTNTHTHTHTNTHKIKDIAKRFTSAIVVGVNNNNNNNNNRRQ